jgi:2-polyprenyl-3-methyl-5-hydroxy-6-metoxy-1,4-benzoquinol methylase
MSGSFAERYPIKSDRHSSHSQILTACAEGNGRKLLDVGCARGHLSSALQKQGWDVTGIEYDSHDAQVAQEAGIAMIVGTAESVLSNMVDTFDVIVFADVLEHFVEPLEVLTMAKRRLKPGGRIVISIPNVAHLTVRLQLLLGSFNYTDRGILDRTHLHFYTKRSLREMIAQANLEVVHLGATPAPIEEVLPVFRKAKPLRAILEFNALTARVWKSLLGYQFIVVAKGP